VTADLGFANEIAFPLGSHRGVVIARFPNEVPASRLVEGIVSALDGITEPELRGAILVIEPGRIRLRRPGR
jgi:hypothetical protein